MNSVADSIDPKSRQLEILRLLGQGKRRSEIAQALNLHPATVNTYCDRLYNRLNVRSAAQAYAEYIRQLHPEFSF